MLLQETHSTEQSERYWQSEWCFKVLFSHGSANIRGTCILFKNDFHLEIRKHHCDSNGRFIVADIVVERKKITLVNVYAPNEDTPEFFDKVFDALKEFDCETIIIGGDFNCVLNPTLDKKGGRPNSKPNCRSKMNDLH